MLPDNFCVVAALNFQFCYVSYVQDLIKNKELELVTSYMLRPGFDYTKWQRHLFEDMTLEELNEAAATFFQE